VFFSTLSSSQSQITRLFPSGPRTHLRRLRCARVSSPRASLLFRRCDVVGSHWLPVPRSRHHSRPPPPNPHTAPLQSSFVSVSCSRLSHVFIMFLALIGFQRSACAGAITLLMDRMLLSDQTRRPIKLTARMSMMYILNIFSTFIFLNSPFELCSKNK